MKEETKKNNNEGEDDVVFELEENSAPADQIKKLREKLKKALAEKDEYLAGWQRAKADLVNFKRESDKERETRARYATEDLLHSLIPVLDSFSLARANKETWERVDQNWRQGIEYIHAQLGTALEESGLSEIAPDIGLKLDTTKHAAMENVTTEDPDLEGCIAEVIQKGYELSGKVIRPARVKVYQYGQKE